MPIYEYECAQCGQKFEVRQSIGEGGSDLSCPECHTSNPKKLFSSFFSPGANIAGYGEPSGTTCPTCSSGLCGLQP